MSKTNLDDLDLETAGIEADEINTEEATAGQVLTADGEGGGTFADGVLIIGEHNGMRTSNAQPFNTDDYGDWRGLMIGRFANFDGNGAIAIGYTARATGTGAHALGYNASVVGAFAIGIGYAQITGDHGVGIGNMATATQDSVSLGNYAGGEGGTQFVSIGDHAWVEGAKAVALGGYTFVQSDSGVAVGYGAQSSAAKAVALGPDVNNGSASSVRIGWGNSAGDYMHMGNFTPSAATPTATHTIPVTLNGATYKILLSNV